MMKQLHLLVSALILTGCSLMPAPNQHDIQVEALPNLGVPARYNTQSHVATQEWRAGWLAEFQDPQLLALVWEAIAYNGDLRAAAARVQIAAAQAKLAGSTLYPAVNAAAHGGGKSGGDGSGLAGVGFFANWELDLWGRARSEREAGREQYASAILDEEYARQSIAALVAKSWLLAIEASLQRETAA